jgi:hypothetical protein
VTVGDIDVGRLDGLHPGGTPKGSEFAAEEARLLDELLASADLRSSEASEVRPVHELSDDDQWQARLSSAPENSLEKAINVVPPFTNAFSNPQVVLADTTLRGEIVKADELDTPDPDPIGTAAESADDETQQRDKRAVDLDLGWLDKLEVRSAVAMSGVVTPGDPERARVASAPGQPLELAVVVPPFTYSSPSLDLAPIEVTASDGKIEVRELETLHEEELKQPSEDTVAQATPANEVAEITVEEATAPDEGLTAEEPTVPDEGLTAEEATVPDEGLTANALGAPEPPEPSSPDQQSDIETPANNEQADLSSAPELRLGPASTVSVLAIRDVASDPAFHDSARTGETTKSRRKTSRAVVAVLAVVFLLTTLGAGFVAVKQHSSSLQWRQRDQKVLALSASLVARNGELSRNLAQVNGSIASLNSQTSRLNHQIKSLQTQLAAAKQAKAKTLGRSLLSQLTTQAASVSSGLAMCVNGMNSLRSEINRDISNLRSPDPHLQPNTQNTDAWCATARQDNQQLQSTLSKAR